MVLVLAGAAATSVLFAADAFFAFAGWRMLSGKQTYGRACLRRLHTFMERRAPFFTAVAMTASVALALRAGAEHPRAMCLAGAAIFALTAHLLLHFRTAGLMRSFKAAPPGSVEWQSRAVKLEAAMVTRASLQAAAFICIVTAGMF